jgi:xanthine dehydrogenase accessory factor
LEFGSSVLFCFGADVNYLTERQNTKLNPMPAIPQLDLYRMINDAGERGERVVVATVAHTRGSTPQQRGAKMVFFQSGDVAGTVGGGCIEAEVWAEAQTAMRSGHSGLHHFSLTADEASEEGMVCGGTMDIFVEVLGA